MACYYLLDMNNSDTDTSTIKVRVCKMWKSINTKDNDLISIDMILMNEKIWYFRLAHPSLLSEFLDNKINLKLLQETVRHATVSEHLALRLRITSMREIYTPLEISGWQQILLHFGLSHTIWNCFCLIFLRSSHWRAVRFAFPTMDSWRCAEEPS